MPEAAFHLSCLVSPSTPGVHSRALGCCSLTALLSAPLLQSGAAHETASQTGMDKGGWQGGRVDCWRPAPVGPRLAGGGRSEAVDEELVGTQVREGCHKCPIIIVDPVSLQAPAPVDAAMSRKRPSPGPGYAAWAASYRPR
jgi:hypothetical protein